MSDKVNLDDVSQQFLSKTVEQALSSAEFTGKIESSKVLDARLEHEREEARVKRNLNYIVSLLAIFVLFAVICVCGYMLITPYPLEEKRLVAPIFSAVAAGVVGFIFGKSQGK